MKRIVSVTVLVLIMLSIMACGDSNINDPQQEKTTLNTIDKVDKVVNSTSSKSVNDAINTTTTKSNNIEKNNDKISSAKTKSASSIYYDKISSCNLPTGWEADYLGENDGELGQYFESEYCLNPSGFADYDIAIGFYCYKDLMNRYSSIVEAIEAHYESWQYDGAFLIDDCYTKNKRFGSKEFIILLQPDWSESDSIQHLYASIGDDFYYIQLWIEEDGHSKEIDQLLSSIQLNDL